MVEPEPGDARVEKRRICIGCIAAWHQVEMKRKSWLHGVPDLTLPDSSRRSSVRRNYRDMRTLIQRVSRAEVRIRPSEKGDVARVSGRIGPGYVVLVGFTVTDSESELQWMAEKILGLRLFPDDDDRMNRSIVEHGGALLVVSQFTLYGDARKGRRPSFVTAATPEVAVPLYDRFLQLLRDRDLVVETGEFGAMMDVELVNDGPVTLWIEREAGTAS
ncbi:MAG TPA: D-aminoacyl-tRNA deacylase [Gemmatimonas sp.]|nr:D-aminoacyl-tRNA deacylase [Gemmatimonas sp.]